LWLPVLVLGCAAVLLAGCTGDADNPPIEVSVSFDWSMPERFGLDADGDGLPDIPNTFEYVHGLEPGVCGNGCSSSSARFEVRLMATVTPDPGGLRYRWEATGGAEPAVADSGEPAALLALPEGEYTITLTVTGDGIVPAEVSGDVVVDDLLVVALGESYASGEGNPERAAAAGAVVQWADDGSGEESPEWEAHQRAHRSALAGPAQAALLLERSDPRTSVTFVFLAMSGATVPEGLLGPHPGVDREELWPDRDDLTPQVDETARLLGCDDNGNCDRTIDALVMSIGGNDAGWAPLLGALVGLERLGGGELYRALLDLTFDQAELSIGEIPGLLEQAAAALDARLDVAETYLLGYPVPTRRFDAAAPGAYPLCDDVLGGIIPLLEIDAFELEMTEERFAAPLNDTLAATASALGWEFVDGHLDDFLGHGYCGEAPYPPTEYPGNPFPDPVDLPGDPALRWFRQADESVAIQGAPGAGLFTPEELVTRGAYHPNELGHRAIADALVVAIGD
jgi:hypothetical protein